MVSDRRRLPFFLAVFTLAACSVAASGGKRLATETLGIDRQDGRRVSLVAEIAATTEDRERGLMFRKALADGEGMLFVFEADQRLSFWMKNTLVPLSIAYIAADGRIQEIRDMTPQSLAPVDSERSVRYALEVPQGWFSRVGVEVGDRLSIPEKYRP